MNPPNNDIISENDVWVPESALDVLIALLYGKGKTDSFGEPIEGITRLDKLMFLLSKNAYFKEIVNKGYVFEPDNFGPFAPELFDDIEALRYENIIEIISSREPLSISEIAAEEVNVSPEEDADPSDSFTVNEYRLTGEGMQVGALIWNGLSDKQKKAIYDIKKTWQNKSLNSLLHYVYNRYPETTEKSKIKDRYIH